MSRPMASGCSSPASSPPATTGTSSSWTSRAWRAGQITQNAGQCRSPIYTSTFYTITEKQPWEQIAFVSTRPGQANECRWVAGDQPLHVQARRLVRCSGSPITSPATSTRRSWRMAACFTAAWRRATFDDGVLGRLALESINTDGSDRARPCLRARRRPVPSRSPCVTPTGLVVFVESDSMPRAEAGRLRESPAPAPPHVPADHPGRGRPFPLALPSAGRTHPGFLASRRRFRLVRPVSARSGERPARAGGRRPGRRRDPGRSRLGPAPARRPLQRGLAG